MLIMALFLERKIPIVSLCVCVRACVVYACVADKMPLKLQLDILRNKTDQPLKNENSEFENCSFRILYMREREVLHTMFKTEITCTRKI